MGHSFDMLTFDFLLKPPQPVTGLFFLTFLKMRQTNKGQSKLSLYTVTKGLEANLRNFTHLSMHMGLFESTTCWQVGGWNFYRTLG